MLVGRVLASENAFADGFWAPITATSTAALTKPSARDTRVPDAMTALARPMPPRAAGASAIARLGRGRLARLACVLPSRAAAGHDEAQQPREEDQREHHD